MIKGTGMGGRITKKDIQNYLNEREQDVQADVPIWETPLMVTFSVQRR